jgi:hypothetical protein
MRWLAILFACTPVLAYGQTVPEVQPETLGFTFDESFLRDLPLSDSLYTALETVQPSIIPDRFTGGGLFTGEPVRVGGFQSSWTQTRFLIGDVDVSDPTGSGASLFFPDLGTHGFWCRVRWWSGRPCLDACRTNHRAARHTRTRGLDIDRSTQQEFRGGVVAWLDRQLAVRA